MSQELERQADKDIAEGRILHFDNIEEAIKFLEETNANG